MESFKAMVEVMSIGEFTEEVEDATKEVNY